jgi:hypothetical protein
MIHLLCALVGSILAAAGSLYLSLGMGLKACPLCFYQRTFAFALIGVLIVGLLAAIEKRQVMVVAFPLAVGGFGVALLHSFMVWSNTLECPMGVADLRTAPEQSLIVFTLILACFFDSFREAFSSKQLNLKGIIAGVVLGGASVYGSICANPMPPKPTAPYPTDIKLETCRFAYRA